MICYRKLDRDFRTVAAADCAQLERFQFVTFACADQFANRPNRCRRYSASIRSINSANCVFVLIHDAINKGIYKSQHELGVKF